MGTGDILDALGDLGTQAAADRVSSAITGSGVAAGTTWTVRAGVDLRGEGNLVIQPDWSLPMSVDAASGAVQPGGMALSVRVGGDLTVRSGLSSGFATRPAGDGAPVWAPTSGSAGSVRLQAGGTLTLGKLEDASSFAPPDVVVRASNGRLDLSAGEDLRFAHGRVAVVSTGLPVQPAGQDDPNLLGAFLGYVPTPDGVLSPFLQGGAMVALRAGRDIIGVAPANGAAVLPSSWAWRGSDGTQSLWWSRLDLFTGGVASFGGGDVTVRAGGSVSDLQAAAADSGWVRGDGSAGSSSTRFGGGSVDVSAGADVLGGSLWSTGSALALQAGGRIGAAAGGRAPDLVFQDTQAHVAARQELSINRLQSFGLVAPSTDNAAGEVALLGLDGGASLFLASTAGDVQLSGVGQTGRQDEVSSLAWGGFGAALPAWTRLVVPQGSLTLGGRLVQRGGVDGMLHLLARDTLTLAGLSVLAGGADPQPAALDPVLAVERDGLSLLSIPIDGDSSRRGLDAGERDPVQLSSATDDVRLLGVVQTARPVRLVAGRDLAIEGAAQVIVQHQGQRLDGAEPQPVSELSLLQAGRDITAAGASSALAGFTVAGPGDLVMLAGRDIDLGASRGVQAVGNQRNSTLLPQQGADLTLVAGLRFDGQDLQSAVAGTFALTGVQALTDAPGTVYAWLAGSGTAADFDALPLAQRLQAVQTLAEDKHAQRLAQWLRSALAFGMTGAKAESAAAAARNSLASDALAQALTASLGDATAADRPARLVQALAREDVRARLDLSNWLRAELAASLNADNAQLTLAALETPLQEAAVGGLLALALAAAPPAQQDDFLQAQWAAAADNAQDAAAQALLANGQGLSAYLARVAGVQAQGLAALQALRALPPERQLPWLAQVLRADLAAAGRRASEVGAGTAFDAAYAPAYQALDALFPLASRGAGDAADAGDIVTPTSQIRTAQRGSITLLAPTGGVNAGALVPGAVTRRADELGIVTVAGGGIFSAVRDNFEVNQSRVFTLAAGDILLWASDGNVDAGRGAKTVTGAPAPVLRLDEDGNLVLDTSGSFSGSGIAALDANSQVGLFAPRGEVNAGEAGISAAGNLTIGAARVVGADNIAVGGETNAPIGGDLGGGTASLASLGQSAAAATAAATEREDDEDERKKRQRRRNLFLDFLGFGSGND